MVSLKTYEANKKADEKKLTQQLNEEFQRKKKNYEQDLENQQNEFIQLKVQSETVFFSFYYYSYYS